MDPDHALLSFIHKNAAMGAGTIPQVMSLPQSQDMRDVLSSQLKEYRDIASRSQDWAKVHGQAVKNPPRSAFLMSEAMLKTQTAFHSSPSKLAEMMIRGSTMGTVQMTRRLHQYAGRADRELLDLGGRLLRTEEQNIQEMKRFL